MGAPAVDAGHLAQSPLYPTGRQGGPLVAHLPPRMDSRLTELHRELYDALLRPVGGFEGESRLMGERFWPDLQGTAVDGLFAALFYFFLGHPGSEVSVSAGLAVMRAVFFNHEAAQPAHWISAAHARLSAERKDSATHRVTFAAPLSSRVQDLAFAINTESSLSTVRTGWISGSIGRRVGGYCRVQAECSLDPFLGTREAVETARPKLDRTVKQRVASVFGWAGEVAA